MFDPSETVEFAVEKRLYGMLAATHKLRELSKQADGRRVIRRQKCLEEMEIVRDALSSILDDVGGK